jgi:hypothetical protein
MADMHMTDSARGEGASGNLATAANWLGAAMSLALIVGVAVWGYRLIVRDVSGVPVVQALEGPMRVAPDNPGGKIARHEGLAVNNIAGTGTSAPPPAKIVLAPQPLDVTEEDQVVAQREPAEDTRDPSGAEELARASFAEEPDRGAAAQPATLDGSGEDEDPIAALANQIAADATPLAALDPAQDTGVFDDAEEDQQPSPAANIIPSSVPGVARSLRPAKRPSNLQLASLSTTVQTVASSGSAQVSDIDPDEIPTGTRLVQFGAYDSPDVAREQWAKLESRFDDYLSGKDRVIEQASSGGRVFYRLRAHGFSDLSDSRRFCAAIVAEGADCIPVVSR